MNVSYSQKRYYHVGTLYKNLTPSTFPQVFIKIVPKCSNLIEKKSVEI